MSARRKNTLCLVHFSTPQIKIKGRKNEKRQVFIPKVIEEMVARQLRDIWSFCLVSIASIQHNSSSQSLTQCVNLGNVQCWHWQISVLLSPFLGHFVLVKRLGQWARVSGLVVLVQFPNLWFVQFQTLFVLHIIFPQSNTILIIFQGPYQEVSMGQALTPEPIYQFSPNVSWLFSFKQILPEVCGVTQSWFLCFGFPSNLERKCLWGCLEPCNRHWSAFNSYCSHKMQLDMWGFGLLWSRRYNETNRGVMLSAPCQGHQVDGVCE